MQTHASANFPLLAPKLLVLPKNGKKIKQNYFPAKECQRVSSHSRFPATTIPLRTLLIFICNKLGAIRTKKKKKQSSSGPEKVRELRDHQRKLSSWLTAGIVAENRGEVENKPSRCGETKAMSRDAVLHAQRSRALRLAEMQEEDSGSFENEEKRSSRHKVSYLGYIAMEKLLRVISRG